MSAIEIVSSMDLLGQYVNWSGTRVFGTMELLCAITSLSKHFMITDECYRAVVNVERSLRIVQNMNDGGHLKHVGITGWDKARL